MSLLLVVIAALASMALVPPILNGVDTLGLTEDGDVLATVSGGVIHINETLYESYVSRDGGMSWSLYDGPMYALDESQSVDTPRGEYAITEWGIARLGADGRGEIVYSTAYLRGDANEWLQERDTRNMRRRVLANRPRAILYHADSGSVIATMGIQGVVVGTPDGRWRRVAVGVYSPTDFSFPAKARALAESGWLVGAIALALSLSALAAAAAASAYKYDMKKDGAFVALVALGVLVAIGAIWAAIEEVWRVEPLPASIALAAALTSWTMILAIVASKSDDVAPHRYALLGCVAPLPIAFWTLAGFDLVEVYYIPGITVAAFISLIPPLAYHARFIARRWRAFAPAFVGMNALIALAFLLWLQMNVSIAATQIAIVVLVGLAAVVLVRHVRGGLRG